VATKRPLQWALEDSTDDLVLRVRGDVDLETAPEFARAVREALARGKSTLIDLSAVTYFDGQGIHVLREYANRTRATLKLPMPVKRSLETLGIDYLFRFR
jgi:anti-anti-sigma factor